MMMIQSHQHHPTVEVPRWDIPYDDPTAGNNSMLYSPQTREYFSALQRYLPSLNESLNEFGESDDDETEFDSFCCDEFRMFEFKVRKCNRGSSHDWTQCPFAHPAEKARRRDPRRYHYSGTACPEFRRGTCRKGDSCEYAHGVFECWLHPDRYRTQPCKDGSHCKRRVCFFAHSPDQLRVLPNSSESPPSQLVNSPPMSPPNSLSELVGSMQGLKLGSGLSLSPRSPWGIPMCGSGSRFGSPRSPSGYMSGFCGPTSSPSTPTRTPTRSGLGLFDLWDLTVEEEEPVMERVESGKDLRARIYSKLSKENSLDGDRVDSANQGPDFEWVCDIVN